MPSKYVKLTFYQYPNEERILVDTFRATDWGDFLVVRLTDPDPTMLEELQKALNEVHLSKQVIILPHDADIDFFGVEVTDD